ncbi:hypothetical protein QYF36_012259 [Acer negundo]|nr:hypothetical protein QYF36_012259 [Acer negundo]
MVVVHGDCGRNLSSGASSVMDPMFIEASLFVGVSFDSPPSEVPKSGLSSQVGLIEASFGFISICVWVDPLVGTCSHSDKGNSVLPSHANGLSSAKGDGSAMVANNEGFQDVAVPHSLVSITLVVSLDPVASVIFSDSISLTASHEQQSESVNAIPIIPRSSAIVLIFNDSSVV